MKKYIKPFLVCEWITLLGATTAAYFRLDIPLYICIGIVLSGVALTLYFSMKYEKNSEVKTL
ncbi:hypothetical protein [Bacillus sp. AK031]